MSSIRPATHGGNVYELAREIGCNPEEILDFSANINPLGFPEGLRPAINRALDMTIHYPDPNCRQLVQAISEAYGSPVEQTIVANGTTEILYLLPRALSRKKAVIPAPCYVDYAKSAELGGMTVETIELREADDFAIDWDALDAKLNGDEVVYLACPNNPTGTQVHPQRLRDFILTHPRNLFVIDEAYADFTDDALGIVEDIPENVIVVLSLTKFYGIPGLRLGFAVAPEPYASAIRRELPPWSVNNLAQAAGVAMLKDQDYATATRALVQSERASMVERLITIDGLKIYPGAGNFLFMRSERPELNGQAVAKKMLKHRIAIRVCDNYTGLDASYIRIAVKSKEDNDRIVEAFKEIFGKRSHCRSTKPKTPAIMFQGTASNAGKSVLTAALCRILLQDGVKVAPFKAQNMSLNSFVTRDGLEMGRAQVTQAQACWLEPDVRMNPVLLKPSSETGSQVIVRGKPVANMSVRDYVSYKETAFNAAKECYDSLAAEYDTIVLEGAGSPGEVNLKKHDIVNMRMAQYASASVLLAGDIDRGGIFASFVGTMEVLSQWERELVKGFVINRFRGDASLLADATSYTETYTGKPTLGIVRYLPDLGLPEEDSVEFKSGALDSGRPHGEHVEIAVIDLPHISNFTDFDALRAEGDVYLHIVRSPSELGEPDVIILPGSKNVLKDLQTLRNTGMAEKIIEAATERNVIIVGVCGGFQMLGKTIADPLEIESTLGSVPALGLLRVSTVLAKDKTLVRTKTVHLESGSRVFGYEIHHGQTEIGDCTVFLGDTTNPAGFSSVDQSVWGTYLHGVFDSDSFRRWFINKARCRKGLEPLTTGTVYDVEPALNRLAEVVRESLDMRVIYQLLGM